jgi:hypothetical protein
MKHLHIILLAALSFVAGLSPNKLTAQRTSTDPANNLIRFESGACRGNCPVYKLTFQKDGSLHYLGIRNVGKIGLHKVRLTTVEYAQLLKEVNKVDLWQYPAEFPSTKADVPVHTYVIFDGEKSHTVKGSTGIPQPIQEFEIFMRELADAHGMPVGINMVEPSKMKGQVIVKFKMDVNAREFCSQFTELTVRPVTHLSEDNTWVIGFDPAELTEEQFVGLLNNTNEVLTVEPNKQQRN